MSSEDKKIQREGLTNQEYSLKHALPIETLISKDNLKNKSKPKIVSNKNLNQMQKVILKAYHDLSLMKVVDDEIHIYEDVRKLNYLYWLKDKLNNLEFCYVEENMYSDESHRIITKNFISTNKKNINMLDAKNYEITDFYLYFAIVLICKGYISDGYIYLKDIDKNLLETIKNNLNRINIKIIKLDLTDDYFIARIKYKKDSEKIRKNFDDLLNIIPCLEEKFFKKTPKLSITKKLVFDSAHYITDHEYKCKNLHGGRYDIEITIKDRIDPMTGFVLDYSLIKRITKNLIINKFDHKTLNLTCPELSWRSSTEFLCIVIWEILINYLPSLKKIKIYETETSYCEYKGNTLEDYIINGPSEILSYFKNLSRNNEEEKNIIGK